MKLKTGNRKLPGEATRRGSALIMVLWVLGLLTLLIGSFAFDARVEARIISYYRKRSKAVYLAKSGIELATMLMAKSQEIAGSKEKDTAAGAEDDPWHDVARDLSNAGIVEVTEELGDGTITVLIEPEPARRNINNLGKTTADIEESMEKILEVGGITEDTGLWPVLIESFLDWTDKDNEPRMDGGETDDHYAALTNAYKAKNGPLDTVGELLLVKGYNRAILYGGVLEEGVSEQDTDDEPARIRGIQDLLTTYGDGKVNVNAATLEVLMTLPGVDEDMAKAIQEERGDYAGEGEGVKNTLQDDDEDYSYKSVGDFVSRIPDLDPNIKDFITTASSIYRITSVGEVGGVKKKVWCVASYAANDLRILRWREED